MSDLTAATCMDVIRQAGMEARPKRGRLVDLDSARTQDSARKAPSGSVRDISLKAWQRPVSQKTRFLPPGPRGEPKNRAAIANGSVARRNLKPPAMALLKNEITQPRPSLLRPIALRHYGIQAEWLHPPCNFWCGSGWAIGLFRFWTR
jgi:hypothetical protein